jgi:hypothetical protein
MREYSYITSYIKTNATADLLRIIRATFETEGLTHTEAAPTRLIHHDPAMRRKQFRLDIVVGDNGWHYLRSSEWDLMLEKSERGNGSRLIEWARQLNAEAIVLCDFDDYPTVYGSVLLEIDNRGLTFASGRWSRSEKTGNEEFLEVNLDFFGTPLNERGYYIKPNAAYLQEIWAELDSSDSNDSDDLITDSDSEYKQRYLMKHLLKISPRYLMDSRPDSWFYKWRDTRHFTLWFEGPEITHTKLSAAADIEVFSPLNSTKALKEVMHRTYAHERTEIDKREWLIFDDETDRTYTNKGDFCDGDASAVLRFANEQSLGGHSDWRIPDLVELAGLRESPADPKKGRFWSSSPPLTEGSARFYFFSLGNL